MFPVSVAPTTIEAPKLKIFHSALPPPFPRLLSSNLFPDPVDSIHLIYLEFKASPLPLEVTNSNTLQTSLHITHLPPHFQQGLSEKLSWKLFCASPLTESVVLHCGLKQDSANIYYLAFHRKDLRLWGQYGLCWMTQLCHCGTKQP